MVKSLGEKIYTQIKNLRYVNSYKRAKRNLLAFGEGAVTAMCKALIEETDWTVQRELAEVLGGLRSQLAVKALVQLYHSHKNWEATSASAIALAKIGNEECLQALFGKGTFDRPIPIEDGGATQFSACHIVGRKAVPYLTPYLKHESKSVVIRALRAISSIATGSLVYKGADISDLKDDLKILLKSDAYDIRQEAIRTIACIHTTEVMTLIEPLQNDTFHSVREEATIALDNIRGWLQYYKKNSIPCA